MISSRRGDFTRGTSVLAALVFVAVLSTIAYAVHAIVPNDPLAQTASATLAVNDEGVPEPLPSAESEPKLKAQLKSTDADKRCDVPIKIQQDKSAQVSFDPATDLLTTCVKGCSYALSGSGSNTVAAPVDKCRALKANADEYASCIEKTPCTVCELDEDGSCDLIAASSASSVNKYLADRLGVKPTILIRESPDLQKALELAKTDPGAAQAEVNKLPPYLQTAFSDAQQEQVEKNNTLIKNHLDAIKEAGALSSTEQQKFESEIQKLQKENQNMARVTAALSKDQSTLTPTTNLDTKVADTAEKNPRGPGYQSSASFSTGEGNQSPGSAWDQLTALKNGCPKNTTCVPDKIPVPQFPTGRGAAPNIEPEFAGIHPQYTWNPSLNDTEDDNIPVASDTGRKTEEKVEPPAPDDKTSRAISKEEKGDEAESEEIACPEGQVRQIVIFGAGKSESSCVPVPEQVTYACPPGQTAEVVISSSGQTKKCIPIPKSAPGSEYTCPEGQTYQVIISGSGESKGGCVPIPEQVTYTCPPGQTAEVVIGGSGQTKRCVPLPKTSGKPDPQVPPPDKGGPPPGGGGGGDADAAAKAAAAAAKAKQEAEAAARAQAARNAQTNNRPSWLSDDALKFGFQGFLMGFMGSMAAGNQQSRNSAPPGYQPPIGNSIPQQPGTCGVATYCQNGMQYQRNNSCVDQVVQACQYGCNGNQCASGPQNQCPPPPQIPPASACAGTWDETTATGPSGQQCVNGWVCTPNTPGATTTPDTTPTGAPTAELSCAPSIADAGTTISITYACGNSATSTGNNFSTGGALSGTAVHPAPTASTTISFGLACINAQGQAKTDTCSVQVARPSIVLVARPQALTPGEKSTIGWVTAGMQSCTVSSPQSAAFTAANASNTVTSGSVETPAVTGPMTIVLRCETLGGNARTASTTVVIR